MPEQKGTSSGGVIAIAAVAFVIGRCSVELSPQAIAPSIDVATAAPVFRPVAGLGASAATEQPASNVEPATVPPPIVTSEPEPETQAAVYYARCADARADGAAPMRVGDPGYGSHLDRDDDGVACE